MNPDKQRPSRPQGAVTLGFEMAVPIALFGILGHQLDSRFDTSPAYLLSGCVLGLAVAFYNLWKFVRGSNRDESDR